MDTLLPSGNIFRELQDIHDTGYFSAQPSLEDHWQQTRRIRVLHNNKMPRVDKYLAMETRNEFLHGTFLPPSSLLPPSFSLRLLLPSVLPACFFTVSSPPFRLLFRAVSKQGSLGLLLLASLGERVLTRN
ncbi:Krueppel-like factor 7 [Trachymyrmex zeteki]|uniref:Krueppel-like factor 7 n=1 Tax=Mycetomoellerius zeteki TaxID=64791 RepID=A0A151XG15_9HYME|nr:Krueppel-like factor 7 [Trachymyrmex zeteki]